MTNDNVQEVTSEVSETPEEAEDQIRELTPQECTILCKLIADVTQGLHYNPILMGLILRNPEPSKHESYLESLKKIYDVLALRKSA